MKIISIIFLAGAEKDVDEIINRYEEQKKGLSESYLNDLDITVSRVKRNPEY